ncbi:hypothetical protein, partial [Streptomyces sp. NPDC096153]|uniref:hypothetical protein n=1 Tax=Streptomyces sp. NPDC096153 TaxID=3155548 RepID=UPI00332A7C16
MSAAPAERPDPYRTQPHAGPRTVTQLRAALTAASTADRCWVPLKIVTGLPLAMVMCGDEESPLVGFQRA